MTFFGSFFCRSFVASRSGGARRKHDPMKQRAVRFSFLSLGNNSLPPAELPHASGGLRGQNVRVRSGQLPQTLPQMMHGGFCRASAKAFVMFEVGVRDYGPTVV